MGLRIENLSCNVNCIQARNLLMLFDKYLVDQELGLCKRLCSPIDRPDILFASALISCDEERFPNIFRLIKIGCTLPITSCTCERSLRRLRNWLRSSMTCRRLALMNIHYAHPRHSGEDLSQDAPKKNRTIKSTYGGGIVSQPNHTVINLFAQLLHA